MLQDLSFGKLENEYRNTPICGEDVVFCMRDSEILIRKDQDTIAFPACNQVLNWSKEGSWQPWSYPQFNYVFRFQDRNCFLWMGSAGECWDDVMPIHLPVPCGIWEAGISALLR